jgi:hypothetical protein
MTQNGTNITIRIKAARNYLWFFSPVNSALCCQKIAVGLFRVYTDVIYFSGTHLSVHLSVYDFLCRIGILCLLSHVRYAAFLIQFDSLNWTPYIHRSIYLSLQICQLASSVWLCNREMGVFWEHRFWWEFVDLRGTCSRIQEESALFLINLVPLV